MRSEVETLDQILTVKAQDVKKQMLKDIQRVEENIDRSLNQQRTENSRMQFQISQ